MFSLMFSLCLVIETEPLQEGQAYSAGTPVQLQHVLATD